MFSDKKRPSATISAEIDRTIGSNIRRVRENVHLGQHEVATLLGVSVPVLARYEDGQERAPASILLELARHLGCHLTELFAGMPSMEAEDEFPGSRPISAPHPDPIAERVLADPAAPAAHDHVTAPIYGAPPDKLAAQDDAATVADIIRAFSGLTNPVLRERLVGLLQALT